MRWLLVLILLIPLLELSILTWLAQATDWKISVGIVIVSGLLGTVLARRQGLRCWREIRRQLTTGELPAWSLLDGFLILLAGFLLVTPGLVTDVAGLLLMIPACRRATGAFLLYRMKLRLFGAAASLSEVRRDEIIDVRFSDMPDETPSQRRLDDRRPRQPNEDSPE